MLLGEIIICSVSDYLIQFYNRFNASYTKRILYETWLLFVQLWPYLVLGIIVSTVITLYVSKEWLAGFFIKNKNLNLVFASLLGVISPLGSYVVIPLSASLFLGGVPMYVLIAFLVSSPLINPSLFFLTSGAFGYEMGFVRVFSAFILGVVAGYITWWYTLKYKKEKISWVNDTSVSENMKRNKKEPEKNMKGFFTEAYKITKWISKYFFLALFLAAGIKILVSPNYIMRIFSSNNFISILLTTAAGVPFYVCGGAAIPIVQQLADLGLSKGAVLAFFISGPVTKISNLVLMRSVFKSSLFYIYLLVGIVGSVLLGVLYNVT